MAQALVHARQSRQSQSPAANDRRVAWLHIPKTGTSFGTTLAHYMNASLPTNAVIEEQENGEVSPEKVFIMKYPASVWFQGLLWKKSNHWGDHAKVSQGVFDEFNGHFFGMFRDPAARARSSWTHFGQNWSPTKYGKYIQGIATKMLAGQEYGLDCTRRATRPCRTFTWLSNGSVVPSQGAEVPNVALAVERLAGFKYVGLTEEYDLSVCLFHTMFGGDCLAAEFHNMRPGNYAHDSDELMDAFSNYSDPYDAVVYNHVKATFWGNINTYAVTRRHCAKICPSAKGVFSLAQETFLLGHVDLATFDYDWPGRLKFID